MPKDLKIIKAKALSCGLYHEPCGSYHNLQKVLVFFGNLLTFAQRIRKLRENKQE